MMAEMKVDSRLVSRAQKYAGRRTHELNGLLQCYYAFSDGPSKSVKKFEEYEKKLRSFVHEQIMNNVHKLLNG